jgi:hypothetical protein
MLRYFCDAHHRLHANRDIHLSGDNLQLDNPHDLEVVKNAQLYMRYASATFGWGGLVTLGLDKVNYRRNSAACYPSASALSPDDAAADAVIALDGGLACLNSRRLSLALFFLRWWSLCCCPPCFCGGGRTGGCE